VLFADIRGYTRLSQSTSSLDVSNMLDRFYDECAEAIWENDGILNKTIGDAVMAVFNFPIHRADHTLRAMRAALGIQDRCKSLRTSLADAAPDGFGVGVGVAGGERGQQGLVVGRRGAPGRRLPRSGARGRAVVEVLGHADDPTAATRPRVVGG